MHCAQKCKVYTKKLANSCLVDIFPESLCSFVFSLSHSPCSGLLIVVFPEKNPHCFAIKRFAHRRSHLSCLLRTLLEVSVSGSPELQFLRPPKSFFLLQVQSLE
jgi:hypothetical protein